MEKFVIISESVTCTARNHHVTGTADGFGCATQSTANWDFVTVHVLALQIFLFSVIVA